VKGQEPTTESEIERRTTDLMLGKFEWRRCYANAIGTAIICALKEPLYLTTG